MKRLKVANGEAYPFPGRRQESPTVARLGHSLRLLCIEDLDDLVTTLVTPAQRQADKLRQPRIGQILHAFAGRRLHPTPRSNDKADQAGFLRSVGFASLRSLVVVLVKGLACTSPLYGNSRH